MGNVTLDLRLKMNFLMLEILECEFITRLRSKQLKLYSLATPFLFDIRSLFSFISVMRFFISKYLADLSIGFFICIGLHT